MPPTTHARLGASSAKRWMSCPGSVALSAGLPDTTSKYAAEGTAAHSLLEIFLSGDFFYPDLWPSDMVAAVEAAADYVRGRHAYLLTGHGEIEMSLERTFDLSPLSPPEPMFGTADVVLWVPSIKHLEVIDYKHGQGIVVEAEENPQLMMYALGATVARGEMPDTVRVTIIQPRADHPDGPVRSYAFDQARLISFKKELLAAAHATQLPDAPLTVGDHCRFCKARPLCPAQLEHAQSVAMVEFDIVPEPELAAMLPAPGLLTPGEIARVIDRAAIMMDWLRDVESHALAFVERGGELPGYKLIEGRSNRVWLDPKAAEAYLARQGLKVDDRTIRKVISPAQAEKVLKAQGRPISKLEQYWDKPEGKKKLAPVTDPRPEVLTSVEADFGALTEPHPGTDHNKIGA